MEHPLQAGDQGPHQGGIPVCRQLAQGHGGVGGQPISGEPEHPLGWGFG